MAVSAYQPSAGDGSAPSHIVANKRIICIEHPCIIGDSSRGIKSLGGEHQLKHLFEPRKKANDGVGIGSSVAVSFRPDDLFAQKVTSTPVTTQNVLVKVTLPRKTGRKRKRGSDDPFEDGDDSAQNDRMTAPELRQRMRDNIGKYQMEPVGTVKETHRFSRLPDYQVRADEASIMREIRDHVALPQYGNLQKFRINLQAESDNITYFPGPPVFVKEAETNMWERRREEPQKEQPSFTKTGKRRRQRQVHAPAGKARNAAVSMDSEQVPQGPPSDLQQPGAITERAIGPMKKLLEERPIVTCRAAFGILKEFSMKAVASTIPHVGYFAGKGPWRDAIVKYGVDPRSDPKYRKYQTLIFRIYEANKVNAILKERAEPVDTHIFNGKQMSQTAAIWQLCDLTDPLIAEVLNTPDIRTNCDKEQHGWYFNGTIAKVRTLMREKMRCILNELPLPGDDYYRVLNTLPNHIADREQCTLPPSYPAEVRQLAADIARAAARGEPKPYRLLMTEGGEWAGGTESAESGAEDDWDEDTMDSAEDDEEDIEDTNLDVDMKDASTIEQDQQ